MRHLLFLLFLIITGGSFDTLTKRQIDSLKPIVKFAGGNFDDTTNINRMNLLAANYFKFNPDSTLFYAHASTVQSRKINYRAGLADGLLQTAHVNYVKGDLLIARNEFDEAIQIFKSLDNKKGLSECYELYGDMLNLQTNYKLSLTYLNLALELNRHLKNRSGIASCYKNIGKVDFGEGHLSASLDSYYKALAIDIKDGNKSDAAEIYNSIGDSLGDMEAYARALEFYKKALAEAEDAKDILQIGTADGNIGEVYMKQKDYGKAILFLNRSVQIVTQLDNKDCISYFDGDLGVCYAYQGKFPAAFKCLAASLDIARQNKMGYDEAYALILYATVFNLHKDYQKAFYYAKNGDAVAVKLGNNYFKATAAIELYKSSAGLGNFEEAFEYSIHYKDLKDSLNINEGIQKLTTYTLSLNFTAKQQQLELRNREKEFMYNQQLNQQKKNAIFIIISGVFLLIAFFYYRQKQRQQKTISMLGHKNREILQQKNSLEEQTIKLNETDKLKNSLISVLAHDLRAPLSTLRAVFALLLDNSFSINEVLEMIPSVVKKLDYTSDFLDTLLFWINSQVDSSGKSAKCFLLKEVVKLEVKSLTDHAKLKLVSITDDVDDDACLLADPDSLRIVLHNLVTNALKFSRAHGNIHISAKKLDHDDFYTIMVKDNGTGMLNEQVEKLFKSKVNSQAGTGNEMGTGMGLMFCKDLIENFKGKIWVSSKKGEGTEFYFTAPAGVLASATVNAELTL